MTNANGALQQQLQFVVTLRYNIFVCIQQAGTYITIWCTTMYDNKTHIPYDRILETKQWLYSQGCNVLQE